MGFLLILIFCPFRLAYFSLTLISYLLRNFYVSRCLFYNIFYGIVFLWNHFYFFSPGKNPFPLNLFLFSGRDISVGIYCFSSSCLQCLQVCSVFLYCTQFLVLYI